MPARRVLIESRRTAAAEAQAAALERRGLRALVCTGPTPDGGACPVLADEPCPVLDEADAVVYDLDLGCENDRTVLWSLVTGPVGLPVITERSRGEVQQHPDELRHCTVVVPFSPDHTAQAVQQVLDEAACEDGD